MEEKYGYVPWRQTYTSEFLSLKCAGDVLNCCSPLGAKSQKEITESMGMIKRIRSIFLSEPMRYNLLDLCAGNALTSVLAVHLLPVFNACAVDIKPRKRKWNKVKRFKYDELDIYGEKVFDYIGIDTVIICVHGCKDLARRIIEIYKKSTAKALFMMPCCNGKVKRFYPQDMIERLGKYKIWCWDLLQDMAEKDTKNIFVVDQKILSPKNVIIGNIRFW